MPNYFARTTGNVNAAIWSTAPTGGSAPWLTVTPTSADVLYANGITVTINVSTTAAEVRNDINGTGATAGGTFTLASGVTLTANVIAGSVAGQCVNVTYSTGSSSIVGNVTGGTAGNSRGVSVSATAPATLTITGTITGGTTSFGVQNGAVGLYVQGTAAVTITGGVQGTSEWAVVSALVNSAITVNGFVTGSNCGGMTYYAGGGTLTVNGTVTGAPNAAGVSLSGASATTTMLATRIKGNAWGNGSSGATSNPGVLGGSASQTVQCQELEWGDRGQTPVSGVGVQVVASASNVSLVWIGPASGAMKTLVDGSVVSGNPAASNVRLGVVYSNGNLTGTLAVPAANQVAAGVAVGSTVGTAVLTPEAAQSACNAALAAFASGRLADVATVASTGQQIADAAP